MKLQVGDRVLVKLMWQHLLPSTPVTIFSIFSGHQAIVITENGKRYKVVLSQCSEPLTETEYFKQILLHSS